MIKKLVQKSLNQLHKNNTNTQSNNKAKKLANRQIDNEGR